MNVLLRLRSLRRSVHLALLSSEELLRAHHCGARCQRRAKKRQSSAILCKLGSFKAGISSVRCRWNCPAIKKGAAVGLGIANARHAVRAVLE